MKLDRVCNVPYSQRVGRYHFQMVQVKLSTPVEPIFGYNLQPYYTRQQQWMTELSDSLSRLYRYCADLDKVAREFDPDRFGSAINSRVAISSRPEAATAKARSGAGQATYCLDIIRVATTQINAGRLAESESPTSVHAGHQQFSLSMGDREELLTFFSNTFDTHRQSLERMSTAINQSQLGITANMESNGNQMRLLISSVGTGEDQAFSLRDISGNSVRSLGVNKLITSATDADFVLDGTRHHAAENRISIGDGDVQIDLLRAGTEPIRISITPDPERLLQHTRLLVNRFNRLQVFLQEQQDTLAIQKLDTFERVARAADGELNQYGIRLLPNGQLELDDKKWLEAVQSRYTDFEKAMKGMSLQFREETIRVQSIPLGAFSRSSEDAGNANPYVSSSIASLQFQQATQTGLYLNLLW